MVDTWGRNATVGTTREPIISETLAGVIWQPTAASTVRVKAGGDANDDAAGSGARTISVEGLDENYDLATDTLTTAGVSASASSTVTFTRVHRAYVMTCGTYGGTNAAEIVIENSAGTADIITIDDHAGGSGQSLHCAYSVPKDTTVWLLGLYYYTDTTKTNEVHLTTQDDISTVAAPFGSQRTLIDFEGVASSINFAPQAPSKVNKPGNTGPLDIWVDGSVSSGTSAVSARMQLLLKTD
jgi:hypothetical protein